MEFTPLRIAAPQRMRRSRHSRHRLCAFFDGAEIVEIIDHQAMGLLDAPVGLVAEKIQPLEACAIAETEAGHRVDRAAPQTFLRIQEVARGDGQQVACSTWSRLSACRRTTWDWSSRSRSDAFCSSSNKHGITRIWCSAFQPSAKPGDLATASQGLQPRHLALEVPDQPLDQEIAERDTPKSPRAGELEINRRSPWWQVPRCDRFAVRKREQRRDRARDLRGGEGYFDENQRLVDEPAGWKKPKQRRSVPSRLRIAPAENGCTAS